MSCLTLPADDRDADGTSKDQTASTPTSAAAVGSKRPAVLADGTYATQAAVVEMPLLTVSGPLPPNLRALLLVGDFFLGGGPGLLYFVVCDLCSLLQLHQLSFTGSS